jgi:acetyl-CoA carboxylase alpha subunit
MMDPSRVSSLGLWLRRTFSEFTPLAGDRYYGEDEAIVGGLLHLLAGRE